MVFDLDCHCSETPSATLSSEHSYCATLEAHRDSHYARDMCKIEQIWQKDMIKSD